MHRLDSFGCVSLHIHANRRIALKEWQAYLHEHASLLVLIDDSARRHGAVTAWAASIREDQQCYLSSRCLDAQMKDLESQ